MARKNELFCLCKRVKKGKPPKKYGIPTKKIFDGSSCTCVTVREGKPAETFIGKMKLMETK